MTTKKPLQIFSCGHSNRPITDFLGILKKHKIDTLADVRTIPLSRFCPHFNQKALQSELSKRNIKYLYRGQNLGGRGVNVGYEEAIDELVGLVKKGSKVAVMCSEGDYHKCHRFTTLTPSFEERKITVEHIEYEKKTTKRNK